MGKILPKGNCSGYVLPLHLPIAILCGLNGGTEHQRPRRISWKKQNWELNTGSIPIHAPTGVEPPNTIKGMAENI
jgi:hypothetical protein